MRLRLAFCNEVEGMCATSFKAVHARGSTVCCILWIRCGVVGRSMHGPCSQLVRWAPRRQSEAVYQNCGTLVLTVLNVTQRHETVRHQHVPAGALCAGWRLKGLLQGQLAAEVRVQAVKLVMESLGANG